ncbi:MAG: aminodeoxychorismate lyase [Oleispira sp.]|nr:aminodeoxychorismate lyase [Oleispira sp.]
MAVDLLFLNGSLINEADLDHQIIDFQDRAFHYGDGVFETLRIHNGDIPTWHFHQQRLRQAQKTLKLPLDNFLTAWPSFVTNHLAEIKQGCAKLVISRGVGPRGYKIPDQAELNWWLKITDLPVNSSNLQQKKYRLTVCEHILSRQPALAGLKHLNRLDQVIARSEWQQDAFDEGIMLNLDGHVVAGTMSNIFWLKDGRLFTPDISQEGIDGCVRRWLLQYQVDKNFAFKIEKYANVEQLLSADAVFISNSLIGIQLVAEIAGQPIASVAHGRVQRLAEEFNRFYLLDKSQ